MSRQQQAPTRPARDEPAGCRSRPEAAAAPAWPLWASTGSGRRRTHRGGVAIWLQYGRRCYLPVGRCVEPRLKPERPWPPTTAPRAAPGIGGGVRRMSSRNVLSSEPSSSRSVNWLGLTVRSSGPRTGSTTATTTFERLGTSNTIPSRAGLPAPTLTSSPIEVISTDRAYCGERRSGPHRPTDGCGRAAIRRRQPSAAQGEVVNDLAGAPPLLRRDHQVGVPPGEAGERMIGHAAGVDAHGSQLFKPGQRSPLVLKCADRLPAVHARGRRSEPPSP
jgi:hypothetical protein